MFHGKQYFGVEDQDAGKKRIDTISLVEELTAILLVLEPELDPLMVSPPYFSLVLF